jgi:arginase
MMKIELIYASWPNSPSGIGWSAMAETVRKGRLKGQLKRSGFEVVEHVLTTTGEGAGDLRAAFQLAANIAAVVKAAQDAGSLSVIVCGSCSVAALGAVAGLGGEDTSILWLDAHADLNTPETTMSGLFEGMAAAIVLGDAWQALAFDVAGLSPVSRRNLCFYGVRDLDPAEATVIEDDAIPVVTDAAGAIEALDGCERLYIHLDMDVHNAAELSVNRYSGEGGLSVKQVRQDLAEIAAALPVAAIALTGLDPQIGGEAAVSCAVAHIKALCKARQVAD